MLIVLIKISLRDRSSVEKQTAHERAFTMVHMTNDHKRSRRFSFRLLFRPKLGHIQPFGADLRLRWRCCRSGVKIEAFSFLCQTIRGILCFSMACKNKSHKLALLLVQSFTLSLSFQNSIVG